MAQYAIKTLKYEWPKIYFLIQILKMEYWRIVTSIESISE